jgi:hypothetical protein
MRKPFTLFGIMLWASMLARAANMLNHVPPAIPEIDR